LSFRLGTSNLHQLESWNVWIFALFSFLKPLGTSDWLITISADGLLLVALECGWLQSSWVDIEKEVAGGLKVNEGEIGLLCECFSCKYITGMSIRLFKVSYNPENKIICRIIQLIKCLDYKSSTLYIYIYIANSIKVVLCKP
jgi:hypothetical protein